MKKQSYFSSRAFRKGSLSLAITVVVIAAIVALNVVMTVIEQHYPLNVDLTADKDYTANLEGEYLSFVQGIDQPTEIFVCASRDDFENGAFASAMVQKLSLADYYYGTFSDSTIKYARQVAMFAESFTATNSNISVDFINLNSPSEASPVTQRFSSEELQYGDIIVACKHTTPEGMEYERYQVLPITDLFTTQDNQDIYYASQGTMSASDITGSRLVNSMVSALYIATRDKSVEVVVLDNGVSEDTANIMAQFAALEMPSLEKFLKKNNYTFTTVKTLNNAEISETAQFLIIPAPQKDLSKAEIDAIDQFLKNDGKYGRNLIYLASTDQPVLPNVEEFLAEWGIEVLPAVAFDKDYATDLTIAEPADSDYTADMDKEKEFFAPTVYRLMRTSFNSLNGYTTTKLLTTSDNWYGKPITEEVVEDWDPETSPYKGQFDLAIKSTYQYLASSTAEPVESNVIAISGMPFFGVDPAMGEDILTSTAYYNSTFTLNLFNDLSGQDEGVTVTIEDKVINTQSFYAEIQNKNTASVVTWVFMLIVPVSLFAISLIIWIKRKRR